MGCGPSSSADDDSEQQQQPLQKQQKDDGKKHGKQKRSKSPQTGGKDVTDASVEALSIKSALLIQKWYRRYKARLEARRRTTWMIYQSIEYSSEASQLHLLQTESSPQQPQQQHLSPAGSGDPANNRFAERLRQKSLEEEDQELLELTSYEGIQVEKSYRGPHLSFPLSASHVQVLIDSFRQGTQLHSRYLLQLLHEARLLLKTKPNVYQASTSISRQVTVVGDLHGKLDDLLVIFYKNGLPDVTNPYVFNGDFVDRGANSVETAALLFACCLLVWPSAVFINRGNHEDHLMNCRYGFIKEVQAKYKTPANKIVRLFGDTFSWLPLATNIDDKILVTHGGISDKVDMERVQKLDRHQYLSALKPPVSDNENAKVDYKEWRQVLDLLWSDPKPQAGCAPNTFRGGGCYFGPNITEAFLRKHKFSLLVRSHECKPDGWEFCHGGAVLTLFSASNYYEDGSNKGAYAKFDAEGKPHIVQYMASKARKLPVGRRLSTVEEGALKDLRAKVIASKTELTAAFQRFDPDKTGSIRLADWCEAMEQTLRLGLPWRTLRPHLAQLAKDGRLLYMTSFDCVSIQTKLGASAGKEVAGSLTEAVYKNKEELETIFRIMDKDNSGQISLDEFQESCRVLTQATGRQMTEAEVGDMARSMDLNSDGYIDFNEFLEAFRIIDTRKRQEDAAGAQGGSSG
uniref:Serine/threonine-protein phosphatase with EF-hands n=1 Tax=Macrostomum lignano TaxID=282301 RepID=A0A1I8F2Q4_9PLAT